MGDDATRDTELDAWIAARDPAAAADELGAAVLRMADDDPAAGEVVRCALVALERCGDAGEAVVRSWSSSPALRYAAAAWLESRGVEPAAPVEPGGLLAELARTGRPDVAVALLQQRYPSVEAQVRVVEEARVVRGRAAVAFLDAVASSADDRVVAKAARKALFRIRSAPA